MICDHLETYFYTTEFLSFLDRLLRGADFTWLQDGVKVECSKGSNRVSNKQIVFEPDLPVCYASLLLE